MWRGISRTGTDGGRMGMKCREMEKKQKFFKITMLSSGKTHGMLYAMRGNGATIWRRKAGLFQKRCMDLRWMRM